MDLASKKVLKHFSRKGFSGKGKEERWVAIGFSL